MKLLPTMHVIFFVTILSAGLVSVARWYHPATFSMTTLWLLLIIAVSSAALLILRHD